MNNRNDQGAIPSAQAPAAAVSVASEKDVLQPKVDSSENSAAASVAAVQVAAQEKQHADQVAEDKKAALAAQSIKGAVASNIAGSSLSLAPARAAPGENAPVLDPEAAVTSNYSKVVDSLSRLFRPGNKAKTKVEDPSPDYYSLPSQYARQENLGFFSKLWRAIKSVAMKLVSFITTCSLKAYDKWQNQTRPLDRLDVGSAEAFNTLTAFRRGLNSPKLSAESESKLIKPELHGNFVYGDRPAIGLLKFYQAKQQQAQAAKDDFSRILTPQQRTFIEQQKQASLAIEQAPAMAVPAP